MQIRQKDERAHSSVPHHVAIIMDGNGRWATSRGFPRVMGHQKGAAAVRRTVEAAASRGIAILTLFAFSSENWKRPRTEVSALMQLFMRALDKETEHLRENGIRLHVLGDVSAFSDSLRQRIAQAEERTRDGHRMLLNIAANYGGRWDIVQAARAAAADIASGRLESHDLNEERFASYLAEKEDVDLLIRTGGEKRISNFLMWQTSYSEIYFSDTLWPDYSSQDLDLAIEFFRGRERRFGMTSAQVADPR
ncbi:MAG: polyprenyl diphosphate synthase [Succinatimonas hippei]|nr:polyprenyl diphosphate synthase [Succinatimonas hippei]